MKILVKSPNRMIAKVAGAVILSLGLNSCEEAELEQSVRPPRAVKLMELQPGGMATLVEFPGQIKAVQQSRKAFEVPGRMMKLKVKEGDEVIEGQVVAQLEPSDYEFARDSANAQLESARAVKERMTGLSKKRAVSIQELELANRDLRTAQANYDRANKALDDTKMLADFKGKVAEILVDDYANVLAKQDVMVIQDDSSLEVVVDVPESMMTMPIPGETNAEKVENSKPVVVLSSMPDVEFSARYAESTETSDPVTRTYEVTLAFTPPKGSLIRPGMTAKVRAQIPPNLRAKSKGCAVPMNAVLSSKGGKASLWKVDAETMTVSRVEVKTGAIVEDSIVVTSGLEPGELVAVSGVHRLREGQQVRRWELN